MALHRNKTKTKKRKLAPAVEADERKWDALIAQLPATARPPDTFIHTKNSYCVSLPDVESNIGVWLARRTFYVYHARVFGDELGALKINAMGGLTVSFNKYGSIADAWNIAVFATSNHTSHDAD